MRVTGNAKVPGKAQDFGDARVYENGRYLVRSGYFKQGIHD
jgi:hypothetical protein